MRRASLHFLNDYVERRALHAAEIHQGGIHPHTHLPEDMPGGIRQAQVYLELIPTALGFAKSSDCVLPLTSAWLP